MNERKLNKRNEFKKKCFVDDCVSFMGIGYVHNTNTNETLRLQNVLTLLRTQNSVKGSDEGSRTFGI